MHRLLTASFLVLCLAMASARPAVAQSLLNREWMAQATPAEVQALLDQGANLHVRNRDGIVPLHLAVVFNKNPAVVALLLDRGANPRARMNGGFAALPLAVWKRETPTVAALLLDRGADGTVFCGSPGRRPVDLASENESLKDTDVYWRLYDAQY